MSYFVFLAELPQPVLLMLIGCIFVLLLLLILLVAFVPSAAKRISCVIDILMSAYYDKKKAEITNVHRNAPKELSRKEESR
jgi:hypothetical protein